jgi:hypothetical protein
MSYSKKELEEALHLQVEEISKFLKERREAEKKLAQMYAKEKQLLSQLHAFQGNPLMAKVNMERMRAMNEELAEELENQKQNEHVILIKNLQELADKEKLFLVDQEVMVKLPAQGVVPYKDGILFIHTREDVNYARK